MTATGWHELNAKASVATHAIVSGGRQGIRIAIYRESPRGTDHRESIEIVLNAKEAKDLKAAIEKTLKVDNRMMGGHVVVESSISGASS